MLKRLIALHRAMPRPSSDNRRRRIDESGVH